MPKEYVSAWNASRKLARRHVAQADLDSQLKPIKDALSQHSIWHDSHRNSASAMQSAMASLATEMKDHKREDDKRIEALEDMQAEIRNDIKNLPQRVKDLLQP